MKTSARILLLTLSVAATAATAADHPFMVTSPFNAAVPFNLTLPSTTDEGKPAKTATIKFVSADCIGVAGSTTIGSAQITVAFNGKNGFYRLPFAAPAVYVNSTEYVLAQQTTIFADAGSTISFGISGDSPTCYLVFSGNLVGK